VTAIPPFLTVITATAVKSSNPVSHTVCITQFSRSSAVVPYSFECPGVGIFPDPTNCHNFYTCDSSLVPNLGTCMDGTGTYEAESKVCRVTPCAGPAEPTITEAPTFTCPSVGLFADPTNCHNFYTCGENLNPVPGTCLKGQGKFDAVNQVCTAETCTDLIKFSCTSTGFFADPNDCHGFYVCDENLNAVKSSCTTIAHFDPQRICVVGPCVQGSATTTAAPVSTVFKCTAEGYFADPKDCRSYYVCDSSLNAVHRVCMGGGGYYDPEDEGCYSGSC
jgi:hypothetical protein